MFNVCFCVIFTKFVELYYILFLPLCYYSGKSVKCDCCHYNSHVEMIEEDDARVVCFSITNSMKQPFSVLFDW